MNRLPNVYDTTLNAAIRSTFTNAFGGRPLPGNLDEICAELAERAELGFELTLTGTAVPGDQGYDLPFRLPDACLPLTITNTLIVHNWQTVWSMGRQPS